MWKVRKDESFSLTLPGKEINQTNECEALCPRRTRVMLMFRFADISESGFKPVVSLFDLFRFTHK